MIIHVYIHLYDNYRILDMPLHSFWSWFVSLLLVEFVYYWTHRALHELNILWAAHQFHHMAEDLNVSTAIRDSVVDLILYDVCFLPLFLSNFTFFSFTIVFFSLDLSLASFIFDSTTNSYSTHAVQFDLSNLAS